MSSVKQGVKRLDEKGQALTDVGKGLSNKDVAEKYDLPRNTISTWLTHQNKWKSIFQHWSNHWKLTSSDYEQADHVC